MPRQHKDAAAPPHPSLRHVSAMTSSRDGDFSDFDFFTVFFRDAGLVRGFAKVASHKITLWIFEPKFRGVQDFSQKIYFMRKVAPWKCGENGMGPDRIPPIQFA